MTSLTDRHLKGHRGVLQRFRPWDDRFPIPTLGGPSTGFYVAKRGISCK